MKVLLVLAVGMICTVAANDNSNDIDWIDYRLASSNYATEPPGGGVECVKPGKMCKGCKDIYLCLNNTGSWESSWLGTCDDQSTCNNGECTTTPNSECALEGKNFECVSIEGVYPDPGVCTKYYYCVPDAAGLKMVASDCGDKSKYAYNPRTTYCDIPLVNDKCAPSSIPICKTPGQTGVLKENVSMYYICKPYQSSGSVLYPYLYICPNGRSYDGNYSCKPR